MTAGIAAATHTGVAAAAASGWDWTATFNGAAVVIALLAAVGIVRDRRRGG